MKKEKLQLIIKVSIPVLIIAGCFVINKLIASKAINDQKTVIVDENNLTTQDNDGQLEIESKEKLGDVDGFFENFGFINDNEILISAGLNREEYYEKYPGELEFTDKKNQIADKDIQGELYKLNLLTLEREGINIKYNDIFSNLSTKSKKINFMREELYDENGYSQFKIYDFINKTESDYREGSGYGSDDIAVFSEDGNYLIREHDENSVRAFEVYDINQNYSKRIQIKDNNIFPYQNIYSKDGSEVYFMGLEIKVDDSNKCREGIYKINSEGDIEKVFERIFTDNEGYKNDDIPKLGKEFTILDEGKRVILTATIQGKYGVYIYDVENKKFHNVVQYEEDAKRVNPSIKLFSVSPDESKIIYRVKNSEYNENNEIYDLYAANIKENRLINRVCINEKIRLCENDNKIWENNGLVKWNENSNKIIFFTGNEILEKNNKKFMDKNEINLITFK